MADVSEIMKLDEKSLKDVQSAITLFHLLGLSDEDITILPQVLKNWNKVVDTVNAHSADLNIVKKQMQDSGGDHGLAASDTPDNIRTMIGFGVSAEKINYQGFGDGGGKQ